MSDDKEVAWKRAREAIDDAKPIYSVVARKDESDFFTYVLYQDPRAGCRSGLPKIFGDGTEFTGPKAREVVNLLEQRGYEAHIVLRSSDKVNLDMILWGESVDTKQAED